MRSLERKNIDPKLKKNVPGVWLPVENPLVIGTPDLHYCIEGKTGWIESKYRIDIPKRAPSNFRLTDKQALFGDKYCKNGGTHHMLVLFKNTNELLLIPGSKLLVLGNARKAFMEEWISVSAYYCKEKINWQRIRYILMYNK